MPLFGKTAFQEGQELGTGHRTMTSPGTHASLECHNNKSVANRDFQTWEAGGLLEM